MPTHFMAPTKPIPKPDKHGWSVDGYTAFYYMFPTDFTPAFAVNLAGIELTDGIKKILTDAFVAGRATGEEIGKEQARKRIREAIGL